MLQLNCTIKLPNLQELEKLSLEDIILKQQIISKQFTYESFSRIMKQIQENILEFYLGNKWNKNIANFEKTPWFCPKCEQQEKFVRRGSRLRIVTCSLGKLSFPLMQLTCQKCDFRFSPFAQLLGLKPRQRYSEEFKEKLVGLVANLSYNKTARVSKDFLSVGANGKTIHKWVQKTAEENPLPRHRSAKAILLDGTGVKARNTAKYAKNDKNSELKIVIGLGKRLSQYNRPKQEKKILGLTVGKSWPKTVRQATKVKTSMLITDGENTFDKVSSEYFKNVPKQRCLWHLPRTLGQYLSTYSELTKDQRKPYIKELKDIIYAKGKKPALQRKYTLFVKKLRHQGYLSVASMLSNATQDVFTYRVIKKKGHKGIATSIIERMMREVKSRSRVSSRWSNQGLENLIKLKLIKQNEPAYWKEIIWSKIPDDNKQSSLFHFQMSP